MNEIAALGIDVGSATAKVAAVDAAGGLAWHLIEPTAPRIEEQARRLLEAARQRAGRPALPAVATGYGRKLAPDVDRAVTEITCHARGVHRRLGHTGTLIDIGGQDSKVIAIGADGKVINFAMNDKCAAGTGRFLEVSATRLEIPIDQLGRTALEAAEEVRISSTCTVFAESEIVSLLARGQSVDSIVRGLIRSLVHRVVALAKSVRPEPPFMLSGGVARCDAVRDFLGEALGEPVELPAEPQLMGAYGAALMALAAG